MAVDGETFGHHKHYTERTLSYLFSEIIPESEFKIVNFGEYLAEHSPEYEVKIKEGLNGEGTSWSCLHGVGRSRKTADAAEVMNIRVRNGESRSEGKS